MEFRVYSGNKAEWRWLLVAANGEFIADSAEGYQNKSDCLHGIEQLVKQSAARVEENDEDLRPGVIL